MIGLTPAAPARNVELKARDPDPERTLARCRQIGAEERGTMRQRDTYFRVARGRVKLRETEPDGAAELIHYLRDDALAPRPCEYLRVPVPDPERLRGLLARAPGILGVVEKERRLFLWQETVRIHLDRVSGLGSFVEIEAVAAPDSALTREHAQARELQALLAIEPGDVVSRSYVDLVLASSA